MKNLNYFYIIIIVLLNLAILFLEIVSFITLLQTKNIVYVYICFHCATVLILSALRFKDYIESK